MKNRFAKRLNREDLMQIPGFSKIYVACEDDNLQDGILWHWTAPAVVFNSGDDPIVVCDLVSGINSYEVDESFAENVPYISFWDIEPDSEQLKGVSEEEFNELPEPIHFKRLAHEITSRGLSFKTFCRDAGLDLEEFNQIITGKRLILRTGELVKIGNALGLFEDDLIGLFAS